MKGAKKITPTNDVREILGAPNGSYSLTEEIDALADALSVVSKAAHDLGEQIDDRNVCRFSNMLLILSDRALALAKMSDDKDQKAVQP